MNVRWVNKILTSGNEEALIGGKKKMRSNPEIGLNVAGARRAADEVEYFEGHPLHSNR